jgi:hypothetical protein
MSPGIAEIRKGYMYGSGRPGLGIDIDEAMAAKYPIPATRNGGAYGTDRSTCGAFFLPPAPLSSCGACRGTPQRRFPRDSRRFTACAGPHKWQQFETPSR